MSLEPSEVSNGLRGLADALEALETSAVRIRSVEFDEALPLEDGTMAVDVSLEIGIDGASAESGQTGSGSGANESPESDGLEGAAVPGLPTVADGGGTRIQRDTAGEAGPGPAGLGLPGQPRSADRQQGPATEPPSSEPTDDEPSEESETAEVPAYKDPEKLRAVYEAEDTFPAMTEALGVDVHPKTVRKHMVDHGIHVVESTPDETEEADDAPEPNEESAAEASAADDPSGHDSDSTPEASEPAYRDPTALERVYEEYDSFEAMRDALDVEVTPQTVRRHMIDHGIHEVASRSAGETTDDGDAGSEATPPETGPADSPESAGEAPEPNEPDEDEAGAVGSEPEGTDESEADPFADVPATALADAPEVLADLSVAEVVEAVATARTPTEVERVLGGDRDAIRDLLNDLDLLEFVYGRMSEGFDPDERRRDVRDRLQERLPDSAQ